jgi:membrane-bound serine protease (ClpP class)
MKVRVIFKIEVTPMRRICLFFLVTLFIVNFLIAQTVTPINSKDSPVYVIHVNQDIEPFLVIFLKRSLVKAKEANASMIIFQLNTFGGRVDSALEITSLIGSVDWAETIAYIPSASGGTGVSWSAGALISFSCDKIIMDSGTSIGAAAPVYQSSEGMVMAEEKTISALRGQIAALAEKNGYPQSVALAMVDNDIVLYEVETEEGMRLYTPEEIVEMERVSGIKPVQGRQISAENKLLTLTAGEMERYAISSATINGQDSLYKNLGISADSVITLEKNRADWFVAFLSSAGVSGLIIMIGLVALYMEVTSPGFGVPGTVALICFAMVFSTSLMMGNLESMELLLFLGGIILLLIEIFIIPGFGITGIGGIILILTSLVLTLQNFVIPEFTWQWDIFKKNLLSVSLSLLGAMILIGILMVTLPKSRLFGRLVLKNTDGESPSEENEERKDKAVDKRLIGKEAIALTDLRPVGKGDFGGEVYIVQTNGEYIVKGSKIVVIKQEGLHIKVKER